MNRNHQPPKCRDLPYLITSILFTLSLIAISLASFHQQPLLQLSMPRGTDGTICPSFLLFFGPRITDRKCSTTCESEDEELGICLEDRVKYMLQQNGEYDEFLGKKHLILSKFSLIGLAVLCTALVAVVMGMSSVVQLGLSVTANNRIIKVYVLITLTLYSLALYQLYSRSVTWLIMLFIFISFLLYLTVFWLTNRGMNAPQSASCIEEKHAECSTSLQSFLTTICFLILSLFQAALCLSQYLSLISSSPYYSWQAPQVYAQVTRYTWKEYAVLLQILYFFSFSLASYEYCISGMYAVSKPALIIRRYFRQHLGSVCKLAVGRLIFAPFFLFLSLLKPLEGEGAANYCHCICGYALNLAHKYSLPLLAYQAAMRRSVSLSESAERVHFEYHISKNESNEAYIEKLCMICLIISLSALFTHYLADGEHNAQVMGISMVGSLWVGINPATLLVHAKEGKTMRRICEQNRAMGDSI